MPPPRNYFRRSQTFSSKSDAPAIFRLWLLRLLAAVQEVPISLWLEAISDRLSQHPALDFDSDVGKAMLIRFQRGIDDLKAVAEYIESKSR